MSGWIQSLNTHSADWAMWMWRICWQAAIVIAVAWLLTILLRSQSPRLRSWIWRLAYLKLLVLLVWTTPVQLPLLPAQEGSGFGVQGSDIPDYKAATAGRAEPQTDVPSRLRLSGPPQKTTELPTNATDKPIPSVIHDPTVIAEPPAHIAWQSLLLLVWLGGIVLVVIWLAWETARAAKLCRSVRIIDQPELQTILSEVCQQLGLRTKVQIGENNLAASPLLLKFLKPTIVFPAGLLQSPSPEDQSNCRRGILSPTAADVAPESAKGFASYSGSEHQLSPHELRLVFAHELAHLKRHDLAWNALSAVVHVLLYFHPLVWLAHRFSRQEQEMSCDELVVTRLGVQRHEYGQMLVKVVRRLGRNFPTGMAVVGMASSYQTLSKRIEAMKRFRHFTRRQIALAAGGLTILGLLTIIPWQVVAQQPSAQGANDVPRLPTPSGDNNQNEAASSSKLTAKLGANGEKSDVKHDSEIEQLLVGTWRDAAGKAVAFQSDGGYQDAGVNIFVGTAVGMNGDKEYKTTSPMRGDGSWRVANGLLVLTYEPQSRYWTGKPAPVATSSAATKRCEFTILRLTKDYLRLKYSSEHGDEAYFLSRDKEKPLNEKYANVPADLRDLFDAAQMTPEEADAVVDLLDAKKNDLSDLQIAGKIQQARIQKITLQKLFGMTKDEVDAFRSLLDQHQHSRQSFKELADGGQLLPIEKDAYEKTQTVGVAFDNLAMHTPLPATGFVTGPETIRFEQSLHALSDPAKRFIGSNIQVNDRVNLGSAGNGGRASSGRGRLAAAASQFVTAELNETQLSAVNKLLGYLGDLQQWYQKTVFKNQR